MNEPDARLHQSNAAGMWAARVPGAHHGDGYLAADHEAGTRVILLDPAVPASRVRDLAPTRTVLVEDAFGVLAGETAAPRRMPIMIRRPAPMAESRPAGVRVHAVTTVAELESAERVMVDGFPLPAHQPWSPGQALPPRLLGLPGWRFWLASVDGQPAAAVHTYDDGVALGVYWLATLPEQRSRGVGRAVLTAAIAARPERFCTLVATAAGIPLYESLGFRTVVTTSWHTRPPVSVPPPSVPPRSGAQASRSVPVDRS